MRAAARDRRYRRAARLRWRAMGDAGAPVGSTVNARVLFVDDSTLVRATAQRMLRARGVACEMMGSLGDVFRAGPDQLSDVAAALLDIELDDGRGTDAAAYLRENFPAMPIAFLTGGADQEDLDRATSYGPIFDKTDVSEAIAWAAAQVASPPPR